MILALCSFSGFNIHAMDHKTLLPEVAPAPTSNSNDSQDVNFNDDQDVNSNNNRKEYIDASGYLTNEEKKLLEIHKTNFEAIYKECIESFYDLENFILLNFKMQTNRSIIIPVNFFNNDNVLKSYIYLLSIILKVNLEVTDNNTYKIAREKILNFYKNVSTLQNFLKDNLPNFYPDSLYEDLKSEHYKNAAKNRPEILIDKFTNVCAQQYIITHFKENNPEINIRIMENAISSINEMKKSASKKDEKNLEINKIYLNILKESYKHVTNTLSTIEAKQVKKSLIENQNAVVKKLIELKKSNVKDQNIDIILNYGITNLKTICSSNKNNNTKILVLRQLLKSLSNEDNLNKIKNNFIKNKGNINNLKNKNIDLETLKISDKISPSDRKKIIVVRQDDDSEDAPPTSSKVISANPNKIKQSENDSETIQQIIAFLCELPSKKEDWSMFLDQEKDEFFLEKNKEKISDALNYYEKDKNDVLFFNLKRVLSVHENSLKDRKFLTKQLDDAKKIKNQNLNAAKKQNNNPENFSSKFSYGDLHRMEQTATANGKETVDQIIYNLNLIKKYTNIDFSFEPFINKNIQKTDLKNIINIDNNATDLVKSAEIYLNKVDEYIKKLEKELENDNLNEERKNKLQCLKETVHSTKFLINIFKKQTDKKEKINDIKNLKIKEDFGNRRKGKNKNKNKIQNEWFELENKKCRSVLDILIKYILGDLNKSATNLHPYDLFNRIEHQKPLLDNKDYVNKFKIIFTPTAEKMYDELEKDLIKKIDRQTYCDEIMNRVTLLLPIVFEIITKSNNNDIGYIKSATQNFLDAAQMLLYEKEHTIDEQVSIDESFFNKFATDLVKTLLRKCAILYTTLINRFPEFGSSHANSSILNDKSMQEFTKKFLPIILPVLNKIKPLIYENFVRSKTNDIRENNIIRDDFSNIIDKNKNNQPNLTSAITKEDVNDDNINNNLKNDNTLNIKPIQIDNNIQNDNKQPNDFNKINFDNNNLKNNNTLNIKPMLNDNNIQDDEPNKIIINDTNITDNKILFKEPHIKTIQNTITKTTYDFVDQNQNN